MVTGILGGGVDPKYRHYVWQEVQNMGDIAINAPTVQEEEAAWTKMLDRFAGLPDVEVRVRCGPAFWKKGGGLREAISAIINPFNYV